jgi:hypothetical protein
MLYNASHAIWVPEGVALRDAQPRGVIALHLRNAVTWITSRMIHR